MRPKNSPALLAAILIVTLAAPAAARDKEHAQLMADIRMLQEQSQMLQTLLGTLNESLRAVNTRLDQQTEVNRKAFADQKLVIDNLSNEARVIREKLDDNNVRVGTLTQEVDALRTALQQSAARPTTTEPAPDAAAGAPAAPTTPGRAPLVGASPKQMFESAQADYFAGQYELAISGFEEYIRAYPKFEQAVLAQVYICNAYIQDGKYQKAVDACDAAVRNYPGSNALADALYHKGMALASLKDINGARATFELVIKNYPTTNFADLARQGLDKLKTVR